MYGAAPHDIIDTISFSPTANPEVLRTANGAEVTRLEMGIFDITLPPISQAAVSQRAAIPSLETDDGPFIVYLATTGSTADTVRVVVCNPADLQPIDLQPGSVVNVLLTRITTDGMTAPAP